MPSRIWAQRTLPMVKRGEILDRARKILSAGQQTIEKRFKAGEASAHETADALAILMDETLQFIWHEIGTNLGVDLADHLALLAVGGYGRGQLAPYSDVDLLFLRIGRDKSLQDQAVEEVLYILWDLGLKVGQAVRTPKECLRLAAEDFTILTCLIEMRLIRGSRQGFIALRRDVDRRLLPPRRHAFVAAKMAERELRHKRHGQSGYVLEPNVKESKGGLRDLHTLSWIARSVFGDGQINTLISHGVFSLAQARAYQAAEAFLLSVRLHLHYLAGHAEEYLSFGAQPEIAQVLGYVGENQHVRVEAFMHAYFRATREVGALTGIMIATIEEELQDARKGLRLAWQPRVKDCDGFLLISGRLAVHGAQQLAETPLDFIRYFLVAHELGVSHAPSSLRLMTQNLRLIDASLKTSAKANDLFLQLLTHEKNPTSSLKTMNETGVLAAFLPQWQSIVGLMQFNRYHHFTVDEHSLHAVDELHRLRAGDLGNMTGPVHKVFGQIEDPLVLFVAVLYHDIAKGQPGHHADVGAKLAPEICARLGLSRAQAAMVTWLIQTHLRLSKIAFQRDVDNPDTLKSIADFSHSVEALRLLYILTVADVRAVGPDTWSAWKGDLLHRAYIGAGEILRSGEIGPGADLAARNRRRRFAEALGDRSPDVVARFLRYAPRAYWLAYETQDCVRHFELLASDQGLHLETMADQQALALTIVTTDSPGLFARLAGAVTLAGWSVVASKAHNFKDGLALDTLFLRKGTDNKTKTKTKKARPQDLKGLRKIVEQVLSGQLTLAQISATLPRARTKRQRAMDRPATVSIHSPNLPTNPTIIEVKGPDRPALLFDLTATLLQLGLTLKAVRVATYGEKFVNVFYVTDLMGYRLEDEDRLARVREFLLAAAEGKARL